MGRLSLTAKFGISRMVLILVIGNLWASSVIGEFRQQMYQNLTNTSLVFQNHLVLHHLRPSDFTRGSQRLSGRAFDKAMVNEAMPAGMVIAKIWRPDGTVLYSNQRALIGRRFPIEEDFKLALSGETNFVETDLSAQENSVERQEFDRLLEIFAN